MNKQTYMTGA